MIRVPTSVDSKCHVHAYRPAQLENVTRVSQITGTDGLHGVLVIRKRKRFRWKRTIRTSVSLRQDDVRSAQLVRIKLKAASTSVIVLTGKRKIRVGQVGFAIAGRGRWGASVRPIGSSVTDCKYAR